MTEFVIALMLLPSKFFEKFKKNVGLVGESFGDGLGGVINGLEKMDTKTSSNNSQSKDDPGV